MAATKVRRLNRPRNLPLVGFRTDVEAHCAVNARAVKNVGHGPSFVSRPSLNGKVSVFLIITPGELLSCKASR
jgi:hypothetical protein